MLRALIRAFFFTFGNMVFLRLPSRPSNSAFAQHHEDNTTEIKRPRNLDAPSRYPNRTGCQSNLYRRWQIQSRN